MRLFSGRTSGASTPLGNPQNAYILSQSGLSTIAFVTTLAPVAFLSLLVTSVLLAVRYDGTAVRSTVSVPDLDRQWALSSGGFLLTTFVLLAAFPSTNAGVVAASVGVVHLAWLQLFRKVPGNAILLEMDWEILVLFVGLFVLVGSIEGSTLVDRLQAVEGGIWFAGMVFLLSNVVSNVPAVVLLSTTVTDPQSWYVLAAVSTLAGNATPVASAATLIVLDQTSRRGVDISVGQLVRVGFPIAVVTTAVATGLLLL